nr:hypothetical protein [Streptomyces sp. DSM 41633]
MEHAPLAGRGGGAAVVLTLLIVLVEAVEAAGSWHRAQELRAQAKAAAEVAVLLCEVAGLTGSRLLGTGPKPCTGRVTRTAGRGLLPAGPVPVYSPAPRSATAGPDRPVGPSRSNRGGGRMRQGL